MKVTGSTALAFHNNQMKIITDFADNGTLPSMYTCDEGGYFPSLMIEDIPLSTKSLALIVDDSDAPTGVRDHLLLANIPLQESTDLVISQDTFDLGLLGQNGR